MIPEFPNFKKIELSDKEEIEKYTALFPSYSDFNFFSMWGWDTEEESMISILNNNLIIIFNDYLKREQFLSFIGSQKVIDTTNTLINFSKEKFKKEYLKLIPEEIMLSFKDSDFEAKQDRDSFDYVYLIENLANINNWNQNTSGRQVRKFLKSQPNYVVRHSIVNETPIQEYIYLFENWAKDKGISNHFELTEFKAFLRFVSIKNENMRFVSVCIDGKLVGFTLYEILSNNFAMSHFAKADKKQDSSVYDLLNWEEAKYLQSIGIKYFNWEQDLGMPGLRYSKIKYKPAFVFKKLTIERRSE